MKIHHEINDICMFLEQRVWKPHISFLHWHENIEFVQSLDNSFKASINGEIIDVNKGDILIIGEHTPHCFFVENTTLVRLGQFSLYILLNKGVDVKRVKTHIKKEELEKESLLCFQIESLLQILEKSNDVKKGEKDRLQDGLYSSMYFALAERFPQSESVKIEKKKRKIYIR